MSGTSMPPLAFGFAEALPVTPEGLAALRAAPEFASLLDLLPIAVFITGPQGTVLEFNHGAETLFGVRRAQAIGSRLEQLRRDSLLDLEDLLAACAEGREAGTVRARNGGGRYAAICRRVALRDTPGSYALFCLSPDYVSEATQRPRAAARRQDAPGLLLSPRMEELVDKAALATARRASVLLLGETGAGKTVLARRIHARSTRSARPFVHVNCGSIPESLFESELFGYERGAFTGALATGKRGHIERAAGGTLFLDEIGEIPLACQAKLLHFLEDGSLQAVGATSGRQVDTAVVSATNRDLRALVAAGQFRRDLYFRISTFTVEVPSLQAGDAVEAMLELQLACINAARDTPLSLSAAARRLLLAHNYEGNVRELKNILECASILAQDVVEPEHLPSYVQVGEPVGATAGGSAGAALRARVREFERAAIAEAIACSGSKREAARRLGIDVATLIRKARGD
jgi:transcriptional regulator with PAS, ATPase and Fis domain